MISRTIIIRKNNTINTIKEFAKIMNIKNYFLCEDSGSDAIDFSFYEKRESWFCYDIYHTVNDGFDYYIEINMYINYNEFLLLLLNASKRGFDICLPNELSESPYILNLFENGHISQVLEDELDNDEVFKIKYDSTLNNELILEQSFKNENFTISIFFYWTYKKGLLVDSISKLLDKFEEPKSLNDFEFLLKNTILKPVLYDYFFNNNNKFAQYYLYHTKLYFYDMAIKIIGKNVFKNYIDYLEERKILGKDFIEIWLTYHEEIHFNSKINAYDELFNIFNFRYKEYETMQETPPS